MKMSLLTPAPPEVDNVEYPTIEPVPEGVERPFWSVMIPTFNRPDYLEQTLRSVLEQDPGADEMQIEVIDNCSTVGDAEAIVRRVGGDRVSFYRQPQTVRPTVQGTTCYRRARGRWVHLLHDDDLLLPGFYAEYRKFIEEHPEVAAVFCGVVVIDERGEWQRVANAPLPVFDGVIENSAYEMTKNCFVAAPTAVVARRALEKVGGMHPGLTYLTDWEMWMRLATIAPVGYIRRPLLLYRFDHAGSESRKMTMNGERNREVLQTIEAGIRRLPTDEREAARREAYRYEARAVMGRRLALHGYGLHSLALSYAFWAFRLDPSIVTFRRLLISALRAGQEKLSGNGKR